jgi:NAD(P)-dependent dehydrogenase (short-subunit alcohol dehydrogenase family)
MWATTVSSTLRQVIGALRSTSVSGPTWDPCREQTHYTFDPAEIAASIAYAASPLAASVVGCDLVIDGGALRDA